MEAPDPPHSIKLGRRVLSSVSPTSYLEVTDHEALKRPCVIVLGGTEATTDKDANALAKRVKHMLGRYGHDDEDVAIYMGTYPNDGNANSRAASFYGEAKSRGFVEDYYRKEGRRRYRPSPEIRQFVYDFILPLLAADASSDPNQPLQATPLPIEEAKRNLRNITIVAHSFGTQVTEQIGDVTAELAYQLYRNEEAVKELTRQVSVLSVGDIVPIAGHHNAQFNTLHVLNLNDEMLNNHPTPNKTLGRDLFQTRQAPDQYHAQDLDSLALAQVGDADNRWVAVAKALPPMQHAMRNDRKLKPDFAEHDFETYAMLGHPETPPLLDLPPDEADKISFSNAFMLPVMAASFLRNSVDNSVRNADTAQAFQPLPDMKSLLQCRPPEELSFTLSSSQDAHPYSQLDKIARASGYHERLDTLIAPGGISTRAPGFPPQIFGR